MIGEQVDWDGNTVCCPHLIYVTIIFYFLSLAPALQLMQFAIFKTGNCDTYKIAYRSSFKNFNAEVETDGTIFTTGKTSCVGRSMISVQHS